MRRSRRPAARPRKLIWARTSGTLAPGATAGGPPFSPPAQFDLLAPFETVYGAQLIGCTIKRVRGYLVCTGPLGDNSITQARVTLHVGDQTTADGSKPLVASDNAFDSASAVLDYMMFEPMFLPISGDDLTIDSAPPIPMGSLVTERIVDVRSQRRLSELNQSLILRASLKSGTAGGPVNISFDLSTLVALP